MLLRRTVSAPAGLLLLLSGLPDWAQKALPSSEIHPPPKATIAAKLMPESRLSPPGPRLTASVYSSIRPQIAKAMGTAERALADTPVPANALTTVGSVVSLRLGPPPPPNFICTAMNVDILATGMRSSALVHPNGIAEISFTGTSVPAGSYLFISYVGNRNTQFSIRDQNSATPNAVLPATKMIPYIKAYPGWLGLTLYIPLDGNYTQVDTGIDIMRIK